MHGPLSDGKGGAVRIGSRETLSGNWCKLEKATFGQTGNAGSRRMLAREVRRNGPGAAVLPGTPPGKPRSAPPCFARSRRRNGSTLTPAPTPRSPYAGDACLCRAAPATSALICSSRACAVKGLVRRGRPCRLSGKAQPP